MRWGIIGYGRFGQLLASALAPLGSLQVYDPLLTLGPLAQGGMAVTLSDVVENDFLFLLVPISRFARCCCEISPLLNPNTVVVDCCSVKVYPIEMMTQHLPTFQPIIGTHPLFGPDSVRKKGGIAGHEMVFCPVRCQASVLEALQAVFKQMGLTIWTTTPDAHDRQMAKSQSLVHFIGRGLAALDLAPQAIATPDFQSLLHINQMVLNDSFQLFIDMQRYNPYTKRIRETFIQQLNQLNERIQQEVKDG